MKIIRKDNLDRDAISEVLICSDVGTYFGTEIVQYLNDKFSGDRSPDYFKLVADDYTIYEFKL